MSPTLHEWRASLKERRARVQAVVVVTGFFLVLVHANKPTLLWAVAFDALFIALGLLLASARIPHLMAGKDWLSSDGKNHVRLDRLTKINAPKGRSGTSIYLSDTDGRRVQVSAEYLRRAPAIDTLVYEAIRRAVSAGKVDPSPISRHNLGLSSRRRQAADAREELDAEIGDTGEPPRRNGGRRHRRP